MAVRQVRRVFATPFIVTLAGSSLAACGPAPLHQNPPGPHTNPPAPDQGSSAPTPTPTPTPVDTPVEKPVVTNVNPPPPAPAKEPAKYEQHWTVMKTKGKAECMAMVDVQCPKPEKGKPVMTCNPPPPIKYACPEGLDDGAQLRLVLRAGATECFVEHAPVACPKGALCNPPPPRKLPCPER